LRGRQIYVNDAERDQTFEHELIPVVTRAINTEV
jgi:hypothetical protein